MAKGKPGFRQLMERAVEVMRQSVAEPRSDGKASPLVGALLIRRDGAIITACRGELREGDHAEFTLLERKNRDQRLDGSILFATLEPCAPGCRRHPKLGCAERIVLARIKEVYVGIEDPDPAVDRKGIKYLQDNGVTVHMFDRDLQEAIQQANKQFIEQALERAAAAQEEKKPKTVTLSNLEYSFANAALDDFSTEALEQYQRTAGIEEAVGTPGFNRRLVLQGLLKQEGEQFVPTGFGLLLFGKEPRVAMPQAGLLGTIHYPAGREEVKDFDGPQVLAPEQALQWLRDKLPNLIDRSDARRREVSEPLFELAREGIVNAVVHRDYGIAGAKCQLSVTSDTITVRSPGELLSPISLEQLQSFNAPMLSRNPALHYVFSRMELAEERGLGLKSMRHGAEQARLPLPQYTWEAPYLVLTLYASPASATQTLPTEVLASLSQAEQDGWPWIASQETVTSSQYAKATGVPNRTALNHLKRFTSLGLLEKKGSGPATRYRVLRGSPRSVSG
jgi:ATP-dependent DNA helicase RecG